MNRYFPKINSTANERKHSLNKKFVLLKISVILRTAIKQVRNLPRLTNPKMLYCLFCFPKTFYCLFIDKGLFLTSSFDLLDSFKYS